MAAGDVDAYWLPFTANRAFKAAPKLLVAADGMVFTSHDGRTIVDGVSGLWCVNAGHNQPRIVEAIQRQAAILDYGPQFQVSHPAAFDLASRLAALAPEGLTRAFFCNSGSEAVDTALKIALAYHRARGEGGRTRLIGRERGYHGAGFGGTSVGGIVANRKMFGALLPGVDHLRHTLDLDRNRWTRGQPLHGVELADDLERLAALHDPSTIAAVIVEPVACSTGVLVPPKGYLQRLGEICRRHGILLIFDEVITGFGRLGTNFAAQYFDVTPDIICAAKGLTNGAVPMGAVLVRDGVFEAVADAAGPGVELAHGYTYSGHPLACAAGLATLRVYEEQGLFARSAALGEVLADRLHELQGAPHVEDIRTIGFIGAIQLAARPDAPGARAAELFSRCYDQGVLIRVTGDTLALSPPFIARTEHLDRIVDCIRANLEDIA